MTTRKVYNDIEEIISNKLNLLATKEGVDEIKYLIKDLSDKYEQQCAEICSLKEHIAGQDKKISQLNDRVGVLSSAIDSIKKGNDDLEQYSRRYCLRINGVKKDKNETAGDCLGKVLEISKSLDVDIKESDIDRAHRIGKKKEVIIVKFHSFSKRTALYRARKGNESTKSTKIHLDLTKQRLDLLDVAKKKIDAHKQTNVQFVFADINCNTVAKLKDGSFKFFNNIEQFLKIITILR